MEKPEETGVRSRRGHPGKYDVEVRILGTNRRIWTQVESKQEGGYFHDLVRRYQALYNGRREEPKLNYDVSRFISLKPLPIGYSSLVSMEDEMIKLFILPQAHEAAASFLLPQVRPPPVVTEDVLQVIAKENQSQSGVSQGEANVSHANVEEDNNETSMEIDLSDDNVEGVEEDSNKTPIVIDLSDDSLEGVQDQEHQEREIPDVEESSFQGAPTSELNFVAGGMNDITRTSQGLLESLWIGVLDAEPVENIRKLLVSLNDMTLLCNEKFDQIIEKHISLKADNAMLREQLAAYREDSRQRIDEGLANSPDVYNLAYKHSTRDALFEPVESTP